MEQEKMQPLRHWAQLSIRRGRLGILDKNTIQLCKHKMDSMFLKCHQCSLERSYAVLTEINPGF